MGKTQWLRSLRIVAWCAVAIVAAVYIVGRMHNSQREQKSWGTAVEPPTLVADLGFTNAQGNPAAFYQYYGKWVVVFFGYRSCPDVCPTGLHYIGDEIMTLPLELQDRIQPLFISLDPDRDRGPGLDEYAVSFYEKMHGWTGSMAQLKAIAKFFGVAYAMRPISSQLRYVVDHSGDLFLVDPQGLWRMVYRPPFRRGALAQELRRVLREPEARFAVEGAWLRQPAAGGRVYGGYFRIRNRGAVADQLLAVQSPVFTTAEIHENVVSGSAMQMQPASMISLESGQVEDFAPGGRYHVMLIDPLGQLKVGAKVPLVLKFASGQAVGVVADLRAP